MPTTNQILRGSVAARLRAVADRLEPPGFTLPKRAQAPLVRLGGRWWQGKDIAGAAPPAPPIEPDG
ncbi:MAG: hypothetical protein ACJ77Z_18715 [Thermoleophilaceae bacterium]